MLKIAIVGPESSGKTTLCGVLSVNFRAPWVPEFARAYLGERDGRYTRADLLAIAEGQCAQEDAGSEGSPTLLFCDTDMITVRIWSEEKFGTCDPSIIALSEQRHYDHWLLCRPDVPWEPDPLRENPQDRSRLFQVYERMLEHLGKPYTIIQGRYDTRLTVAIASVKARVPGDD